MRPVFEYSDTLNTPYEAFLFDAQIETFPVLPHWHYYMEIMMMSCYNKPLPILVDRNMSKTQLIWKTGISTNAMARFGKMKMSVLRL